MKHHLRWLSVLVFAVLSAPALAQTTFTNATTILLPAPPGTGSSSNAVPGDPGSVYPSPIVVSGLGSSISKVTLAINDFRHVFPGDVDMLLVGPQGQKMLVWSDVGGLNSTCGPSFNFTICNNQAAPGSPGPTIILDDAATADLTSVATLVSGTFKPTNVGSATDMFPAPAPPAPFGDPRPDGVATLASVFNGTNPNGTWNLYVIDDAQGATGRINGGWRLTITTAGGSAKVLDIDDNGSYDALTDGLLVYRYLFGLTGASLTNGALGSNSRRTDPGPVLAYLADIRPRLDIDGNGTVHASTDGLLVLRYLFGLRGAQLAQDATGAGATRTVAQIETYLQSLRP